MAAVVKRNIDFFYTLASREKEGIGTAYEYLVKSHLINKLFEKIGKPKNILIAGLPEKYGFGLDSLFLASLHNCNIDIIDERDNIIGNLNEVLKDLIVSNLLMVDKIKIQKVEELGNNIKKHYELAISSAVLQRVKEKSRIDYLKKLSGIVRYAVLFVPNQGNKAHQKYTGLDTLCLEDLLEYSKKSNPGALILDSGRIDLPPFPPGIKISTLSRKIIETSWIRIILMKFLDIWAYFEFFFPRFIKNKFAHLGYVILEFRNEENS